MIRGIILAGVVLVVGLGGAIANLVAWIRARKDIGHQFAAVSRLHVGRNWLFMALLGGVLAITAAAAVPLLSASHGGNRHPSGVVPIASLPDPASGGVEDVAFSPNGELVATADLNGQALLWNLKSKDIVARFHPSRTGGIDAVRFNSTGITLAAGGRNGIAYLWNSSGVSLIPVSFHCAGSSNVTSLAFQANGDLAIGGGSADAGFVCLIDPLSGRLIARTELAGGRVSSLAASPDGEKLAAGTSDGNVYMLNGLNGAIVAELHTPSHQAVSSVEFSPGGKLLAIGELTGQTELRTLDGRVATTLQDPGSQGISSLSFSPRGGIIAIAALDGKTYLWDIALHKLIAVLADPDGQGVSAVVFNGNGALIATADLNGRTYIWRQSSRA